MGEMGTFPISWKWGMSPFPGLAIAGPRRAPRCRARRRRIPGPRAMPRSRREECRDEWNRAATAGDPAGRAAEPGGSTPGISAGRTVRDPTRQPAGTAGRRALRGTAARTAARGSPRRDGPRRLASPTGGSPRGHAPRRPRNGERGGYRSRAIRNPRSDCRRPCSSASRAALRAPAGRVANDPPRTPRSSQPPAHSHARPSCGRSW